MNATLHRELGDALHGCYYKLRALGYVPPDDILRLERAIATARHLLAPTRLQRLDKVCRLAAEHHDAQLNPAELPGTTQQRPVKDVRSMLDEMLEELRRPW
jgi:hypothetical protein